MTQTKKGNPGCAAMLGALTALVVIYGVSLFGASIIIGFLFNIVANRFNFQTLDVLSAYALTILIFIVYRLIARLSK